MKVSMKKWRSVSFLIAVCLLLYWPVVGGRIPIPSAILHFPVMLSAAAAPVVGSTAEMGDLVTQVYPWRSFASQTIRSGALPLWNFHTLLGAPLIANHQSAVFYPFNFTYYILPVPFAWALGFMVRFLMAAGFCVLYARSLGMSRAGALAAGVVFATCGSMTSWNGWTMVDSALWLPLGLFAVDRLRAVGGPGWIAIAAIAFSMPAMAGHPEMALFVMMTTVLYAIFRLPFPFDEDGSGKLRFIRDFGFAGSLAAALAAIQIFPTIEWLGTLEREVGAAAHWGSRPLGEMIALFSRDARSNPNSAGIAIPEGAAYAGIFGLMLAFLSPLLVTRKRELIFFGLLLLVTLQVTYGWGPFYPFITNLPVFESFPNWRMILIGNFSIAILAGFGLTVFQRELSGSWRAPKFLALLISGGLVCSFGAAMLMRQASGPAPEGSAWKATLAPSWSLILVAVAVLALVPSEKLRPRSRGMIVLFLLSIEMTTFAFGHIPFVSSKTVFPEPLLYRWLKDNDPSFYRIAALDGTSSSNLEMVFGMDSPVGYDFPTRRTASILAALRPPEAPGHVSAAMFASANPGLLDLMNIKYVLTNEWAEMTNSTRELPGLSFVRSDGPAYLFRRERPLGRIFLIPQSEARVVASDDEARERVMAPDFDPRREVVVTAPPEQLRLDTAGMPEEPQMRVMSMKRGHNSFSAQVESEVPAIAVFSDIHYPGWQALVNGEPAALLLANYAFKAAIVPAGRSTVSFVYSPWTFRIGLITSLAALCILSLLLAVEFRRMRALQRQRQDKARRPKRGKKGR
jgi:hypothetical protein